MKNTVFSLDNRNIVKTPDGKYRYYGFNWEIIQYHTMKEAYNKLSSDTRYNKRKAKINA